MGTLRVVNLGKTELMTVKVLFLINVIRVLFINNALVKCS